MNGVINVAKNKSVIGANEAQVAEREFISILAVRNDPIHTLHINISQHITNR